MVQVPLILIGLGNVGRVLLRQILASRAALARRTGLQLNVVGLADSQALLFDPAGLSDDSLTTALGVKITGCSLSTLPESHSLAASDLSDALQPGAILVDATASIETGPILRTALQAGCGVVLTNKHPLSDPWDEARILLEHPRLRYEATVGAGLPAIATLRTLLDTGDQVGIIEGCLSGTLGYLCAQLECGVPYSAAVSQAHSLGYTEPDPREDLSGRDVARKALILARTSGWPLEMADLTVEPLYPESLAGVSTPKFMAVMSTLDEFYAEQIRDAQARDQVLRYTARISPDGGTVGLASVGQQSLLGALRGPANCVAFYTSRYADIPLTISGPGAGPEVTAAGVVGDIVNLALCRKPRATNHVQER